jgi:membrane protease YdiL (CAAX protease family)
MIQSNTADFAADAEKLPPFRFLRDGLVLLFAMLFPTLATWSYFTALAATPWMMPAYAGSKLIQLALPIVWLWLVCRQPIRLRHFSARGLPLGLLSGLAIAAVILAVYYALPRGGELFVNLQRQVGEKIEQIGVVQPLHFLMMAAFIAVIHSLFEEYYWRWFVFGQLRRCLPVAWAAVISSAAFASHHVLVLEVYIQAEQKVFLLPLFAAGVAAGALLWAGIYHCTGSLGGAWLSHFIIDAALMWIGFELWRGNP